MERSYENRREREFDVTNELQLLIESLEKKKIILNEILTKSKRQGEIASAEVFDAEQFDLLVDEKSELLIQMDKIDQGFDAVYHRIKEELLDQRDAYKPEIASMQQLIGETIELGAQIHATEARTKESVGNALKNSRQELRQRKVLSKSVMDYYKASSQLGQMEPYFIDKKK